MQKDGLADPIAGTSTIQNPELEFESRTFWRFSYLDRHLDRFQLKKLQTKIQKCSPFTFLFFSITYGSVKKPDDEIR